MMPEACPQCSTPTVNLRIPDGLEDMGDEAPRFGDCPNSKCAVTVVFHGPKNCYE